MPVQPVPTAARLACLLDRPLVVVDVGCRWGFEERWRELGPNVRLIGVDADATECARLRGTSEEGGAEYIGAALGAAPGPATFHVTREPACSSLYPPDPELTAERRELQCATPVSQVRLELTTLDLWSASAEIDEVDFLKLDVQGSELDILRGAERVLRSVRALEVEVELNPIYIGQPLFGDIDRFLRGRGFVLWRLGHLVHYGLPEETSGFDLEDCHFFDSQPVRIAARGGQIFWAHAWYVRREAVQGTHVRDDLRGRPEALRDACLARILGFADLAARAFHRAERVPT